MKRNLKGLLKLSSIGNLGWTDTVGNVNDEVGNWIANDIIKGGRKSRMIYGAGGALTLLLASMLRAKKRNKKIRLRDMLAPLAIGYGLGSGYKFISDVLGGMPYKRNYDTRKLNAGDVVLVGVSGGGDGSGSTLDRALRNTVGTGNYAMFRHGDTKQVESFIRSLPKGVRPVVIGHSYGAAVLPELRDRLDRKDIEWHSIDPVSWRGRLHGSTPAGTLYIPDNSVPDTANNITAFIGGRWNNSDYENKKTYVGGHDAGVYDLVKNDIIPKYLQ